MRGRCLWYRSLERLSKSRIRMMHGVLALVGTRKLSRTNFNPSERVLGSHSIDRGMESVKECVMETLYKSISVLDRPYEASTVALRKNLPSATRGQEYMMNVSGAWCIMSKGPGRKAVKPAAASSTRDSSQMRIYRPEASVDGPN
jgi:hypothetical protein